MVKLLKNVHAVLFSELFFFSIKVSVATLVVSMKLKEKWGFLKLTD
jgi:hypothetical protein